jgi:hypothetical protein
VKVDDCYDLSSVGTLTSVNSLEYVVERAFATDCT